MPCRCYIDSILRAKLGAERPGVVQPSLLRGVRVDLEKSLLEQFDLGMDDFVDSKKIYFDRFPSSNK